MASITATGVLTPVADGPNFDYTITLTYSSSSNACIGTFWYAWQPGEDLLHTNPISVTAPTGWTESRALRSFTSTRNEFGVGDFSDFVPNSP